MEGLATSKIEEWSTEFNIPKEYWYVKAFSATLSSIGSKVPLTTAKKLSDEDADRIEQVIHILESGKEEATPITQMPSSLMKALSDTALYSVRVYLVRPSGREIKIDEIRDRVRSDLFISD